MQHLREFSLTVYTVIFARSRAKTGNARHKFLRNFPVQANEYARDGRKRPSFVFLISPIPPSPPVGMMVVTVNNTGCRCNIDERFHLCASRSAPRCNCGFPRRRGHARPSGYRLDYSMRSVFQLSPWIFTSSSRRVLDSRSSFFCSSRTFTVLQIRISLAE